MKVSIITLHSVFNYGTQLQAYATQEKMKEYFENVDFINFRRKNTYGFGLLNIYTKGNPIKVPIIIPTLICWHYKLKKFQNENLNIQNKEYKNFDKFEDNSDIYISGSDQVWNTGWNEGILSPFYLDFVPDNKPRYAFASSFGTKELDDKYVEETRNHLKKFKKISVREKSGLNILNNKLKINNGIRIVDPTLAFKADYWRKLKTKKRIKGDYILIYNLNRSKEFDEYAKKLSEKTGYKLYRFCTRYDQILRNGKSLIIPDIFDFITYIDDAKYVLTDSFHATAFAINLNTEPICVYPQKYSGRLSEFLKLVDSEQMHIKDYNDFDVINRHVDFKKVNKILDEERKKIDDYLKKIVDNEKAGD